MKSLGLHGRHFAASGSIVYLAGDIRNTFTKVAGMPRNNLAAVNVVTHRVTSWAPKVNRYVGVVALAVSGNEVLVAGDFASLDYLSHQPENYSLVAGIHVDREALLAQRLAAVVVGVAAATAAAAAIQASRRAAT